MTLAQLRTLVAVVEAGSFSVAAERLALTQSAVSHAIAGLETDLGVSLLHRDRGGPVPTPAGERVLAHARAMLRLHEHIRQEAAAASGQQVGRVRVGTPPSVSARLLPGVLAALRRRHPGIEVVLFEGSDHEVDGWLRSRAVDVGIVPCPARGLDTVELVADEFFLVVPAAHALGSRASVRLREVAAEPFIMSKGGCEPMIRHLYRTAGTQPSVRYEVRDMPTLLAMVQEGLGVTVVPALSLPPQTPRLRALHLEPPGRRRLALAVLSREDCAPVVGTFLREARRWARSRRPSDGARRVPRPVRA